MGRNNANMVTLTFGSFPRSANHYTLEALHQTFDATQIRAVQHSIKALAEAEQAVTTIRHPLECIPSWIMFTADKRANRTERILEWYIAYYTMIEEHDPLIFSFENITQNANQCMHIVAERHGLPTINDKPNLDLTSNFHMPTLDKTDFETLKIEIQQANLYQQAIDTYHNVLVKCAKVDK